MSPKRAGFTLVEILVVVGIIAVLAALTLAVFNRVREQGRKSVCASNLKQIGLAILQYSQDNAETLPLEGARLSIQPYLQSTQIFECPSDIGDGSENTKSYYKEQLSSYSYNDGVFPGQCFLPRHSAPPLGIAGLPLARIPTASRVVLVLEKSGKTPFSWHDGPVDSNPHQNARSNVAFVDGHVKFIKMYLDDLPLPAFTYDDSICYDPPGTLTQTSGYEYQWSNLP